MRQIDSRIIDRGSQTSCSINLDDEGFIVAIENERGRVLTTVYIGSDADAAFDAYEHPFVNPKIETPFDRDIVTRIEEYAEAGVPI